ncbi:MAG: hypothetical protein IKN81_06970 [Oscillospiraceae bacterium]|nr:hypothetical protein [Oscillospiraceae bacterium]
MQSKTSFFNRTVFLHDLKRWWPLTAGYTLLWLFLPLGLLTALNHDPYLSAWNAQYDALNIAGNVGYWSAFFTGILFAMAAFSYLTNPRATYGLHALPERRETLYVTHYLAGLCSQLAPLLLTVLLSMAALATHGAFSARLLEQMSLSLMLPPLFFYSFAVFCMMFTGQILAAPVFYGALNVLVVGMELLVKAFAGNFLYGWMDSIEPTLTAFSPIVKLVENGVRATQKTYEVLENGVTLVEETHELYLLGLDWLLIYTAAGLVFAALGLLVYRKRHSEATGSTVAIDWARPIFKYGVTFCAALALGQLLYFLFFGQFRSSGSYSLPGTLGCMALAGLIGYFLAEMLLKKSFRVWKSGWRGAVAVVAVLVAMGCAMTLDLTGYEGYVPDVDDVQAATVSMNLYNSSAHTYLFGIRDPETIRLITEAHQSVVSDKARQLEWNDGSQQRDYSETGAAYGYLSVDYTLSDGRLVQRRYPHIVIFADELDDPDSLAATLTALNNSETAVVARTLGRYYYNSDTDPRTLPDLRFTGGDVYLYRDDSRDRVLTAHEAELIYDAVLRDVAAEHVSASLFENEPVLNADITLYATYSAPDHPGDRGVSVTHPSDVPPGRDMVTYDLEITERMTETVATLRAMDVDVTFG